MAKQSRLGRINRKPTDERRQFPALHTSKARLTVVERARGGLRLHFVMPNGKPRTYPVTFGR